MQITLSKLNPSRSRFTTYTACWRKEDLARTSTSKRKVKTKLCD